MKRGGRLQRRTPLRATTALRAGSKPLRRGGPIAGRASARQKAAQAALVETRRVIWQRSGGRCELCGHRLDPQRWEASHRRHDGMGGQGAANQAPSNVLASCGGPFGCNQRLEADPEFRAHAEGMGWVLRRSADPLRSPVWLRPTGRGWVRLLLTDDGRYAAAPEP